MAPLIGKRKDSDLFGKLEAIEVLGWYDALPVAGATLHRDPKPADEIATPADASAA